MLNLLIQFKEREGHLDVPQNHQENDKNLGSWLSRQRYLYKKGILDEHRDFSTRQRWGEYYNLMLQFKKREGHLNVPQDHVEDDKNLGFWLNRQREAHKNGILEGDRVNN